MNFEDKELSDLVPLEDDDNSIEEDIYCLMKKWYKIGKADYPSTTEIVPEMYQEYYTMGWLYKQWEVTKCNEISI